MLARQFVLQVLLVLLGSNLFAFGATPKCGVDVILWFDTEDYILPADDDACKRLAEMLTERQIRATFKIVGEKARVLERRDRHDVIKALRKHDIAFHSDFHSVHPTPTEYLADCGWLDGIAEFKRREAHGAADVRRIFSVRTLACYGQPGSSWAPQAIAALKELGVSPHGIPCYVDEGDHVGLDERPFWYAGALNVYHLGQNTTRMELHEPDALEPAKEKVAAIAQRLRDQGEGGLISIYYHPCEWVHQQFWDGVNFSRGANPPREQWKLPPQRTRQETEAAFQRFGQYIDYIRSLTPIRFITASDLPELYPDLVRTDGCPERELSDIALEIASNPNALDFKVLSGRSYSLADQMELLTKAVSGLLRHAPAQFPLTTTGVLGPDGPAPEGQPTKLDWAAFATATLDLADYLQTEHRVPARVFVGAERVSPAAFLVALASVYNFHKMNQALPREEGVALPQSVDVLPERHVAKDTPELFGGWVIHKEGFRAPKLMELARLQAWTLKPAVRRPAK